MLVALQRRKNLLAAHLQKIYDHQGPRILRKSSSARMADGAVLGPLPHKKNELLRPTIDGRDLRHNSGVVDDSAEIHGEVQMHFVQSSDVVVTMVTLGSVALKAVRRNLKMPLLTKESVHFCTAHFCSLARSVANLSRNMGH